MATEVVMPRLSDTMESGTVAKWLKHEGDQVKRGDILAEIETDKSNMELESYASGILARIMVNEGQSAGLGQPIAVIAANEQEAQNLSSGGQPENAAQAPPAPSNGAGKDEIPPEQAGPPAKPQVGRTEPNERIKASPLARRLAQEHDIDLADIAGTGPGGRITKEDVQSFLKQTAATAGQPSTPAPSAAPTAPAPTAQPSPAPTGTGARGAEPVTMSRMQSTIARRMAQSKFSAPEFLLTAEFDLSEARALLESIRATEGAPRVGPNDLLIKAAAGALRQHPEVNAGWENDTIVRYSRVNVGNAVAIEGGLVVPVIQDADRKSLGQIATESKALAEKARAGKLQPNEYEGGTFTISNLGMYGIDEFTAIINAPEACILAVGAIAPQPVVREGQIVIRDRMRVTMSCDHRVINGAIGAQFLQTLRRLLEQPMLALI